MVDMRNDAKVSKLFHDEQHSMFLYFGGLSKIKIFTLLLA